MCTRWNEEGPPELFVSCDISDLLRHVDKPAGHRRDTTEVQDSSRQRHIQRGYILPSEYSRRFQRGVEENCGGGGAEGETWIKGSAWHKWDRCLCSKNSGNIVIVATTVSRCRSGCGTQFTRKQLTYTVRLSTNLLQLAPKITLIQSNLNTPK